MANNKIIVVPDEFTKQAFTQTSFFDDPTFAASVPAEKGVGLSFAAKINPYVMAAQTAKAVLEKGARITSAYFKEFTDGSNKARKIDNALTIVKAIGSGGIGAVTSVVNYYRTENEYSKQTMQSNYNANLNGYNSLVGGRTRGADF